MNGARKQDQPNRRRALVAVQVAVMAPVLLGFAALTIDVGAMYNAKAELQRTADSAALAAASMLAEFAAGDPRIRRLFPDARAEQAAYFKKTGIYPITHTVVMHQTLAREEPWVAERLVVAFREAQRLVDRYYSASPKRLSLPGAAFIVEEE